MSFGGQLGCPPLIHGEKKKRCRKHALFCFPHGWEGGGATRLPPSHPCGKEKTLSKICTFLFSAWMGGGQPGCPPPIHAENKNIMVCIFGNVLPYTVRETRLPPSHQPTPYRSRSCSLVIHKRNANPAYQPSSE